MLLHFSQKKSYLHDELEELFAETALVNALLLVELHHQLFL